MLFIKRVRWKIVLFLLLAALVPLLTQQHHPHRFLSCSRQRENEDWSKKKGLFLSPQPILYSLIVFGMSVLTLLTVIDILFKGVFYVHNWSSFWSSFSNLQKN